MSSKRSLLSVDKVDERAPVDQEVSGKSYLDRLLLKGLPLHVAARLDRKVEEVCELAASGVVTEEVAQEMGRIAVYDALCEVAAARRAVAS